MPLAVNRAGETGREHRQVRRSGRNQLVRDFLLAGLLVDDHQLGGLAVLDEEDLVQPDRLESVDFRTLFGIEAPDDLFLRGDFGGILHAGEEDVAVAEEPDVVVFPARPVE